MEDFRLKVFVALAEHLNYTKVSHLLCISQPAVSKHIKTLEESFKVRLFDRHGAKISLTHAGRVLFNYSKEILKSYNRLNFAMSSLTNEVKASLCIGASTTIANYFLPGILALFSKKYPAIALNIIADNSDKIERALFEDKIDIGLVEGVFKKGNLCYEAFFEDELVAVTSIEAPFPKEITLCEFQKTPLVLRELGSGTLDVIKKELESKGVLFSRLNVVLYLGSTQAIKAYLSKSDCLGIISVLALTDELASRKLRIIDIENLSFKRNFCTVLKQGEPDPLVKLFVNFLKEYAHKVKL